MVLTHTPFVRTPHNSDTKTRGKALYPGMVDYVDDLVGRLVKALDDLGIRGQTLVIFTTDNGSPSQVTCRAWGRSIHGAKGKLIEAGIRVPFIANCPGRVPAGKVVEDLVDFSDILPTLAELAGASLPAGVTIDGRSFAPTLLGKSDARPNRQWIYSQYGEQRVIRDKRFKLYGKSGRFYDLQADPFEEKDLAGSNAPEVATARKKLSAVLETFPPDAKLPFEARKRKAKQSEEKKR